MLRVIKILILGVLSLSLILLPISSSNATQPWGSINFDGTQYLSSTNMSAPGTGAFTYEFWFYNTAESGSNLTLMNTRQSVTVGQNKDGFDVAIDSNRRLFASYKMLLFFATSNGAISTNRWYHFAIVRQGNVVNGYLDGESIGSQTLDSDGLNLYSQRLWIGSTANGANKFVGNISNFRYTKDSLYSTNFSPPTDDYSQVTNTSILLNTKNDASFINNSVAGTSFTNNGGVTAAAIYPFRVTNNSNADEEARRNAEKERQEKIRAAREEIVKKAKSNQSIAATDLTSADLGVTKANSVDLINKGISSLTDSQKSDFSVINKVIAKYQKYEILGSENPKPLLARELINVGILPPETPQPNYILSRIQTLPSDQRDTVEKVAQLVKEKTDEYNARKAHLAAVLKRG